MPKTYPKLLSLIVPVYKQEKTIRKNLRAILGELELLAHPYEVIVVVDGMVDKSFEEAKKVKSLHVVVTGYKTNHGKGYAVRYGIAQSKGNIIGFIDSGGDIHADGLAMMLAHYHWYNADIIVGSKRHPVSKIRYPRERKLLSWGYQMIIRILFGLSIRDSQVGMKMFRREVLEDVLPRLLVKQFAFDIEILAVANYLGYSRIFEAPVELDFTGVSSITNTNFLTVAYKTLSDTLAVFYRLRIRRYYDNTNKRKWVLDPELNFRINTG